MNKKNLLPSLAAPVQRKAVTSYLKNLENAGIALQRLETLYNPYKTDDCDWCVEDCEKYASDFENCVCNTCGGCARNIGINCHYASHRPH